MKIKKSFVSLLSLLTVCSFTCSGVLASRNSVDDMEMLPHRMRKRRNAIALPQGGQKQFTNYKIKDASFAAPGMKKIIINDGARVIDKNAFFDRQYIYEVVIPKSVEVIDEYAFVGCSNLSKIVIKGEVTIKEFAFLGCEKLVEICIEGNIKNVAQTSFCGCKNLGIIRSVGDKWPSKDVINMIGDSKNKIIFFDH